MFPRIGPMIVNGIVRQYGKHTSAINHGIMTPLGLQQAAEAGKSVLFLVEASGAAWVGLSLAFAIFGNKSAKKSAPGAVIIMFFGGIAEVCFPYCLLQSKRCHNSVIDRII